MEPQSTPILGSDIICYVCRLKYLRSKLYDDQYNEQEVLEFLKWFHEWHLTEFPPEEE